MHFRPWFPFFSHPPPGSMSWGGGGKGLGKKQHLLTSLEMTSYLLTPSDQLTLNTKEVYDIVFLTLTFGWKNEKQPSCPIELDLEAVNLVKVSFQYH